MSQRERGGACSRGDACFYYNEYTYQMKRQRIPAPASLASLLRALLVRSALARLLLVLAVSAFPLSVAVVARRRQRLHA